MGLPDMAKFGGVAGVIGGGLGYLVGGLPGAWFGAQAMGALGVQLGGAGKVEKYADKAFDGAGKMAHDTHKKIQSCCDRLGGLLEPLVVDFGKSLSAIVLTHCALTFWLAHAAGSLKLIQAECDGSLSVYKHFACAGMTFTSMSIGVVAASVLYAVVHQVVLPMIQLANRQLMEKLGEQPVAAKPAQQQTGSKPASSANPVKKEA